MKNTFLILLICLFWQCKPHEIVEYNNTTDISLVSDHTNLFIFTWDSTHRMENAIVVLNDEEINVNMSFFGRIYAEQSLVRVIKDDRIIQSYCIYDNCGKKVTGIASYPKPEKVYNLNQFKNKKDKINAFIQIMNSNDS